MLSREKLAEIYDLYGGELLAFALGFIPDRDAAEDVLHDAFVRLINFSARRDIDESNIRALLYRITKNLCYDRYRKGGRALRVERELALERAAEPSLYGEYENKEVLGHVREAAAGLDEETRAIYHMRIDRSMGYGEIADLLGVSERTAKRKMSRAIEHIRRFLKGKGYLLIIFFVASFAILCVLL